MAKTVFEDEVSFTETPEFKAAVQKAASDAANKAVEATMARLTDATAKSGLSPEIKQILDGLALSITELTHQGDKRDRPVDPAVLAERHAAYERMCVLLEAAARIPKGDDRRPKYKTRSKQNLNHHMIEPWRTDLATKLAVPVEFRWLGEPNDAMIPLNDTAKAIYVEFRASRGNKTGYEKDTKQRRPWLTHNGLLIEGTPPRRREIANVIDPSEDVLDASADPFDPNATHVRVLGSIHPPARQYTPERPI